MGFLSCEEESFVENISGSVYFILVKVCLVCIELNMLLLDKSLFFRINFLFGMFF